MTLFPHGRWLLCRPAYFDVTYEINPWMSVQRAPHSQRAQVQWRELHHTLLRLGAWIEYVEPQAGLPDMVFTANAGLVKGKEAVLSNFKYPERQGEAPLFKLWLEQAGYRVHVLQRGFFEGEGDALFAGPVLFGGYGFRSNEEVFAQVQQLLGVKTVVTCKLTDPRFYHLDTCFCPLTAHKALYYPPAFTADSIAKMERHIELIPICEADANRFACNAVVLGEEVVVPAGCAATVKLLADLKFSPHEVVLDEFMKAGGSAKCLSLKI